MCVMVFLLGVGGHRYVTGEGTPGEETERGLCVSSVCVCDFCFLTDHNRM